MQNPCGQGKLLFPPPPPYRKMSTHSSVRAFHIHIKIIYPERTCHFCQATPLKLINLTTMQLLEAISTAK